MIYCKLGQHHKWAGHHSDALSVVVNKEWAKAESRRGVLKACEHV